ncbi:hypothetical protein [Streptomyces sp. NPDC056982]|uniref:hypothetical protein n=1 Tax=Streptomyces sp. NPDC056982 TaxID=3345986 RepID=UPI00363D26BF
MAGHAALQPLDQPLGSVLVDVRVGAHHRHGERGQQPMRCGGTGHFWLPSIAAWAASARASGGQLDEPAVWRLCASLAKRAGLPVRGPHGTTGDAVTRALLKPDARPDKVQRWADHKGSRTTQRYNKRRELLDDSPGYGIGADLASALAQDTASPN